MILKNKSDIDKKQNEKYKNLFYHLCAICILTICFTRLYLQYKYISLSFFSIIVIGMIVYLFRSKGGSKILYIIIFLFYLIFIVYTGINDFDFIFEGGGTYHFKSM